MLIDRKRVARRYYRPFTIQLKSRANDDPVQNNTEVRSTPGRRTTGIAVVLKTPREDHTVYQEEIRHSTDISHRLQERRNHRRRRRSTKWYRAPRFDNRGRAADRLPPSLESIVSNDEHRIARLFERSGASAAVIQDSKFDTRKNPRPDGQRPRLPARPALPDPPAGVHPRTLGPPVRLLRQGHVGEPNTLRTRPRRAAQQGRAHQHRKPRLGLPALQPSQDRQEP